MCMLKEDLRGGIWRKWNIPMQEGIRSKLAEEGNIQGKMCPMTSPEPEI